MKLLIVESPTKSKTLQGFLSKDYLVKSSYGHVRDLPKGELGIDVENNFKPKYVIPLKARKNVNILKKEAKKADSIILAVDGDREGEAIAYHLTQVLDKQKSYQRIVFHEITKQAIEEALKNPRKIDMNLVASQQARRILDRIVGYKLSPFLWKKVARGLSAGRVQSIAVRLVVEREREIEKFIPQEYWSIAAQLKKLSEVRPRTAKVEFEAVLNKKDDKIIPKLEIKTQKETDKIAKDLKGAEYKIASIEKKEMKRNPLPPFTTSTLQQESWKKFRFPARFTMRIAQQLYEKGLTSYHRTDSLNLSDLSLFAAKKHIEENYGKEYWAGFLKKYKTKTKGAQEAHEAIRPTYPDKTPEILLTKLEKNQFKLYDLIWCRFIACQMAQARFDSTVVEIQAQNTCLPAGNAKYIFRANGQTLKFDGFLKVYPIKFKETELPVLEKQEILELIKLIPSQHFTKPAPRYTEATLIKALEENGIGRPSTYAPTLTTIQYRNYVEKDEKKSFYPTEVGILVNDLLAKHFPKIINLEFTAKMEKDLDEIASNQKKWTCVIREFYEPFIENLKIKEKEVSKKELTQEITDKICPLCKKFLIIKLGRFGKFLACSGFPECKYTENINKTINVKCPKCEKGEIIEKRTRKGKLFYACSRYPKCDFALWQKPTGQICPKCKSLLVEAKKGKIKCSNPKCDYEK